MDSDQGSSANFFHNGKDNVFGLWTICFLSQLFNSAVMCESSYSQYLTEWSWPYSYQIGSRRKTTKWRVLPPPDHSHLIHKSISRYSFKFSMFLPAPIKKELLPSEKYWENFFLSFLYLCSLPLGIWGLTCNCEPLQSSLPFQGGCLPIYPSTCSLYFSGLLSVLSLGRSDFARASSCEGEEVCSFTAVSACSW